MYQKNEIIIHLKNEKVVGKNFQFIQVKQINKAKKEHENINVVWPLRPTCITSQINPLTFVKIQSLI